uniref:Type III potassium channel toxin protein n=1 Tax=Anemonia sulcata TaxID=6108 RepID=A0A0S1M172_ANESU|nr:type III potassium channel toxin protein [Anemonia sulcata]
MNKVLFLFFVVLVCATIVLSEHPTEERRVRIHAKQCTCGRYSEIKGYGDYWFWRGSCPGGYGYTKHCTVFSSVCCFPRH